MTAARWTNTAMRLRIDATGEHRDHQDKPFPDGWVFMTVDNHRPLRHRRHPDRSHDRLGDLGPDPRWRPHARGRQHRAHATLEAKWVSLSRTDCTPLPSSRKPSVQSMTHMARPPCRGAPAFAGARHRHLATGHQNLDALARPEHLCLVPVRIGDPEGPGGLLDLAGEDGPGVRAEKGVFRLLRARFGVAH
jgi:hypothetical protein